MDTKFNGKIWTFGDVIDTDTIIPGKRGTIPTIEEMKRYSFELLKPEFGTAVKPGDILVAGKNFGCGSSREQAATVLSHNGVRCIIAKSFARIFYRNSINIGLPIMECPEAVDAISAGDTVSVDFTTGLITDETTGKTFQAEPFPPFIQKIIADGGLMKSIKNKK